MIYRTSYPWFIEPHTHGISNPLALVYRTLYTWYFHPLSIVYRAPYPWY
jgi:hypothetical protein